MFNDMSLLNKGQITISNLRLEVKIFEKAANVTIDMDIFNLTKDMVEFDYIIPFIFPNVPKSFKVCYKNICKKCFYSKKFPIIEFDDEVSRGNLTIRLYQQRGSKTYLNICNFNPNDQISISIELLSNLIETSNSNIFEIPLIERYSQHFYPDYSITILNYRNYITNQPVRIKYNDNDYRGYNMNHLGININDISLTKTFTVIIPREIRQEQTCKHIRGEKEALFSKKILNKMNESNIHIDPKENGKKDAYFMVKDVPLLNSGQITISNLRFEVKIFEKTANIKIDMDIFNLTKDMVEFDYILPFIFPNVPKFFKVCYKNKYKKCFYSTNFPIIEFDDEVSRGNLTIRLYQQRGSKTYLNICNFNPNDQISISIELLSNLIETSNSNIFEIPLIERYSQHFYPDYSITILNYRNYITNQPFQIKYNDNDYREYNMNHLGININDISLTKTFTVIIPHEIRQEQTCKHIRGEKDIIFFIDKESFSDQSISTCIHKFIKNYGNNFRFNIVRVGSNGDIFSRKMTKNDKTNLHNVEKFLSDAKVTDENYEIERVYSNIFNNIECNEGTKSETDIHQPSKTETTKEKHKSVHKLIEDVDRFHTVAIFIGSFSDNVIIPHTVPTYLIETTKKHNSYLFACLNNINYINTSEGIEASFNKLIQSLRTDTQTNLKEDIKENQKYEIMIRKEINQFLDFLLQSPTRLKTTIDEINKFLQSNTKHPHFDKKTLSLMHIFFKKNKQFKYDQTPHDIYSESDPHFYAKNELLGKKSNSFDHKDFYSKLNSYILQLLAQCALREQKTSNSDERMKSSPSENKDKAENNKDSIVPSCSLPNKPQLIPSSQNEKENNKKTKMPNHPHSYNIDSKINQPRSNEYKSHMIKNGFFIFDDNQEDSAKTSNIYEQMKSSPSEIKDKSEVPSSSSSSEDESGSHVQFETTIKLNSKDGTSSEVRALVQIPHPSTFIVSEHQTARFVISPESLDEAQPDLCNVESIEVPQTEAPDKLEPVERETKKDEVYFEFSSQVSYSDSTFNIRTPNEAELVRGGSKIRKVGIRTKSDDLEPKLDLTPAPSILPNLSPTENTDDDYNGTFINFSSQVSYSDSTLNIRTSNKDSNQVQVSETSTDSSSTSTSEGIKKANEQIPEKMNQRAEEVNKSSQGFTETHFLYLMLLLCSYYHTIIYQIESAIFSKQKNLGGTTLNQKQNMFFDSFAANQKQKKEIKKEEVKEKEKKEEIKKQKENENKKEKEKEKVNNHSYSYYSEDDSENDEKSNNRNIKNIKSKNKEDKNEEQVKTFKCEFCNLLDAMKSRSEERHLEEKREESKDTKSKGAEMIKLLNEGCEQSKIWMKICGGGGGGANANIDHSHLQATCDYMRFLMIKKQKELEEITANQSHDTIYELFMKRTSNSSREIKDKSEVPSSSSSSEDESGSHVQFETTIKLNSKDGTSSEVRALVQIPHPSTFIVSEHQTARFVISPESLDGAQPDLCNVESIEIPQTEAPDKLEPVERETKKDEVYFEFSSQVSYSDSTFNIRTPNEVELVRGGSKIRKVGIRMKSDDLEPKLDLTPAPSILPNLTPTENTDNDYNGTFINFSSQVSYSDSTFIIRTPNEVELVRGGSESRKVGIRTKSDDLEPKLDLTPAPSILPNLSPTENTDNDYNGTFINFSDSTFYIPSPIIRNKNFVDLL